jgi:hypothetical protein
MMLLLKIQLICTSSECHVVSDPPSTSPRPARSAVVAHRLISNALGVPMRRSAERDQRDRAILQQAKGKWSSIQSCMHCTTFPVIIIY